MTSRLSLHIIHFVVYSVLQILLIRNLILFDKAFCFIYIAFLLLLPLDMDRLLQMIIGFVTGLLMDIFYDSLGIHTAASVLLMYLRPYWLNTTVKRESGDSATTPILKNLGFENFSLYVLPLIFVHHLALFYIELGGIQPLFFYTLLKVVFSTLLTYLIIVIFQYLFYSKQRAL